MLHSPFGKTSAVILIALFLATPKFIPVQNQSMTIRLAGDEWFLNILTKTQTIGEIEKQTNIHVEVLDKNDRAIMSKLDLGAQSQDGLLDVIVVRHRLLGALVQKDQI